MYMYIYIYSTPQPPPVAFSPDQANWLFWARGVFAFHFESFFCNFFMTYYSHHKS